MTELSDLTREILDGVHDHHFDAIRDAIASRRDILSRRAFHELQPGDRVRVTSAKSRYLIGATATLKEKRVTKVTIVFDEGINDPYGKWAGQGCILSPSQIEKIEDTVPAA